MEEFALLNISLNSRCKCYLHIQIVAKNSNESTPHHNPFTTHPTYNALALLQLLNGLIDVFLHGVARGQRVVDRQNPRRGSS